MYRTDRFHQTFDRPSRTPIVLTAAAALVVATVVACGVKSEKRANDTAMLSAGAVVTASSESPRSTDSVVTPEVSVPANVSYATAESAFTQHHYAAATDMFAVYVQSHPKNAWGHYMQGLAAWKSGDLETARQALERSLELDPRNVKILLNLGRVLLDQGQPEEAQVRVGAAIEIDSTSAEAQRMMGRVQTALGQPDSAIEAYRTALVLDPKDVWSMNNLGLVLIEQGDYQEALRPLARAVQLRPEAPLFQNNLGIALERTGHFNAAAEAFQAALAADSTYTKASVSLARVEGRTEDPSTAPVELASLAQSFEDSVRQWQHARGHPLEATAAKPETPER